MMQWTHDTPTVPGLYAWRTGWIDPAGRLDGGLFIVYAPAGTLGILRICRPDGTGDAPIEADAVADEQWLGPLPE